MSHRLSYVLPLFALAAAAGAQNVCAIVSPNVVPPGVATPLTVTVQDATGAGYQYAANCVTTSIHTGSPTGPAVPLFLSICGTTFVTVAPYGSASKTYNLPATLAAGHYFVRIRYRLVGTTTLILEYVPFQVAPAGDPLLTATTIAQVGQTLSMNLAAPAFPGEIYVAAASLTTNTGIPAGPGVQVALDADPVFFLSFPVPLAGVFTNFQNVLDPAGNASGINVTFPNDPLLAYLPFHVQAAVVPAAGSPVLTNCLNFCIAP